MTNREDLWWVEKETIAVINNLPEDEEFWLVVFFNDDEGYSPPGLIEDAPDNWRSN